MTKKEIVSLSLKLAGIYCLIMALSNLTFTSMIMVSALSKGFWNIITSMAYFAELLLSIAPFVLLLLLAAYLIFSSRLPSRVAASMTQEQEEKTTACTFRDIQMLAFSIVGVWLLFSAIPSLIRPIARVVVLHLRPQESSSVYSDIHLTSQVVAGLLKSASGIYLFFGGKGLVRLWQKLHPQEA